MIPNLFGILSHSEDITLATSSYRIGAFMPLGSTLIPTTSLHPLSLALPPLTSFPLPSSIKPSLSLVMGKSLISKTFKLNISSMLFHHAPFLSHLFNTTSFPTPWTLNIIHPILKSGDACDPSNYYTIMIGHTMAKLYATILEDYISQLIYVIGFKAGGQVGFRRDHRTTNHILTLREIIEEVKF